MPTPSIYRQTFLRWRCSKKSGWRLGSKPQLHRYQLPPTKSPRGLPESSLSLQRRNRFHPDAFLVVETRSKNVMNRPKGSLLPISDHLRRIASCESEFAALLRLRMHFARPRSATHSDGNCMTTWMPVLQSYCISLSFAFLSFPFISHRRGTICLFE